LECFLTFLLITYMYYGTLLYCLAIRPFKGGCKCILIKSVVNQLSELGLGLGL